MLGRNRTHGVPHITSSTSTEIGVGVPVRGEDFFQEQLIVFWGPNQYIGTNLVYVPPLDWPDGRLLRNIRVARIIHDAFIFTADEDDDSGDPDGDGNPGDDGCQIEPEFLGQTFFFCLCLTKSWRADPDFLNPQGIYRDVNSAFIQGIQPGAECLDAEALYGDGTIGDMDISDLPIIIQYQNATSPAGLPKNIFQIIQPPAIFNQFRIATGVDEDCNPTSFFQWSEGVQGCPPKNRFAGGNESYWVN